MSPIHPTRSSGGRERRASPGAPTPVHRTPTPHPPAARPRAAALAAALGLILTLGVGGCGLISREAQVEKIDDAIAVSVQADVQNVAQQLRIWYAGAVSDPVLVNSGGKYYLCAPEDAATIDGCTSAGPVSNGVVLVLARTGAVNFCVQGSLTETGEVWHQAVSGGVQQGAC